MIKPNMPNMPGIGNVTDTLEFMKNLWGGMGVPGMTMPGMNLPGMVTPTLSVEEINKRITDLKTVESWLALNMNMLRTTIQALEVQAATIAALQSMGNSFSAGLGAVAKVAGDSAAAMGAGSGGAVGGNGHGARDSFQEHQERESAASATPQPASRDEIHAASLTAPLVNAAAWWNALQDQFKQAVSSAISPETEVPEPEEAKPKPAAKPRAKSASSSAPSSATTASRKRKPSK